MNLRSITFFANKEDFSVSSGKSLDKFSAIINELKDSNLEPRTIRLTLPSISLNASEDFNLDISASSKWYHQCLEKDFRWVNQPFSISSGVKMGREEKNIVSSLITKKDKLFSSINVNTEFKIREASDLYSSICKSISRGDKDRGFSNFRFGIGFNILEYTPFFPFSHGSETSFSIALESYEIFEEAINNGESQESISMILKKKLEEISVEIEEISLKHNLTFKGFDWSLAPMPNSSMSVVKLIEKMSGNLIGSSGSLSAISALTSCLKYPLYNSKKVKGVGFNGVMLSVLEDDVLSKRFEHRQVKVNDLLLYSSVCGCGLDMIPLSGDTPEVAISGYSIDTGSLAFKLNKPLGVRFLPITHLRDGQRTEFNHDFLNNTSIISL